MNIEKLKQKYETGDWVVLFKQKKDTRWLIAEWKDIKHPAAAEKYDFKLIHKKHEKILNAYLEDSSVEIQAKGGFFTQWTDLSKANIDFIADYTEDLDYKLKNTKQTKFKSSKIKPIKDTDITCKCGVINNLHQEDGLIKCNSCGHEWYTQEYYEEHRSVLNEQRIWEAKKTVKELADNSIDKIKQFEKFGFEMPEFECEILEINNKTIIGKIYQNEAWFGCTWRLEDGICETRGFGYKDMNLTPLKKEWYECEDNFPCIVYDDECNSFCVLNRKFHDKSSIKRFRPATKEEAETLIIKGE